MNRLGCALALGVLLSVVGSGRGAWAQEDPEAMHTRGNQLRTQHRDAEARDVFRQIYERTHEPRALARMGMAEAAMEDWVAAEAHVEGALALQSDPWIAQNRTQPAGGLEGVLARARQHLGSLDVVAPVPGAEVWIGGRRVATLPLPRPIRVVAGTVAFEVRATGHATATRSVEVPAGETATRVEVPLPAAAGASAAANPTARAPEHTGAAPAPGGVAGATTGGPRTHTLRYVGLGLIGAGVAAGVLGVVEWLASSAQSSDALAATAATPGDYGAWARYYNSVDPGRQSSASDVCASAQSAPTGNADAAAVRGICSSNATSRALGLAFGIGGAVLTGVGVALAVLDPGSHPRVERLARPGSVRVSPLLGPRVQGAALTVEF